MKNKTKNKAFTITNNTDTVDIDAKSIGLHVGYSEVSELHTARGLHIQIRHNRDKATFNEANRVAKYLTASTHAIDLLESTIETIFSQELAGHFDHATLTKIDSLLKSVRGTK